MDDITWDNKVKECKMILKLGNAILDKIISDEDYNELIKYWSDKEEYKYCDILKNIKNNHEKNCNFDKRRS